MSDALTVPQAAERLGKSRWTLRRHINATGEVAPGVRVFRIGSRDLVSKIQLDEFLRTGRANLADANLAGAKATATTILPAGIDAAERGVVQL